MKKHERSIAKDRKRQYKRLKKLIKARDAASKYFKEPLKISTLVRASSVMEHTELMSIGQLAARIVRNERRIQRKSLLPPPMRKS